MAREYAKGICPGCGRIVPGRADGIEADPAARRWVVLRPHNRQRHARRPVVCLPPGGYSRVRRIRG
jgi:predicted Fe-S protein YdhL (DUF1289 family)